MKWVPLASSTLLLYCTFSLTTVLGQPPLSGPLPGVLALRNGEVISGRILRDGDRYLVTFGESAELRIAVSDVDTVGQQRRIPAKRGHDLVQFLFAPPADCHAAPCAGQRQRGSGTNTRTTPGDQSRLSDKCHVSTARVFQNQHSACNLDANCRICANSSRTHVERHINLTATVLQRYFRRTNTALREPWPDS